MSDPLILVTGASGFTGAHFVRAAAEEGYRCIAAGSQIGFEVEGAESSVTVDLTDRAATFGLLRAAQPDYVVHLAAVSFVGHEDLSELYLTNIVGTINLVDAAVESPRKPRKLIVASSANVYGDAETLPIRESSIPRPQNDYAVSKVAMEHAVSLRAAFDRVAVVRPFNYTGVGQANHFLVPKIVGAYARGEQALTLGNIDVSRDFSDVRDVVRAYLGLLVSPAHGIVVNICSGRPVSVRFILEYMSRLAGYDLQVVSSPALMRRQEIPTLYGSDELLRSIIGEYRRHTFEETLQWMYRDLRGQQ